MVIFGKVFVRQLTDLTPFLGKRIGYYVRVHAKYTQFMLDLKG
jgi:hypothetical protein